MQPTSPPGLFDSIDWSAVAYAAFMATLISVLMTVRQRNLQAAAGKPLSPWRTVIPDTLIGTVTGTLLALGVPAKWPALHTVSGIGFLAGAGGLLGPKIWALVASSGLQIGLKAAAGALAGPLGALAKAASEAASPAAPSTSPPAPPPPAVPPQEAGERDDKEQGAAGPPPTQ